MICDLKVIHCLACIIVLSMIATNLCHGANDFGDFKQRRAANGASGLFPFPRVGRSDPNMFNEYDSMYPLEGIDNYDEEMRRQEKRQGLVPFPRVGKSEGYNPRFWQHEKRSVPVSANSHAMWFGPRLGKRSPNEETAEPMIFIPRLG